MVRRAHEFLVVDFKTNRLAPPDEEPGSDRSQDSEGSDEERDAA